MSRLKRSLSFSALIFGLLFLLVALIPGDFSFLGLLKSIANRFVADGNFEAITIEFYDRLRLLMGVAAMLLLIVGSSAVFARKQPRLVWGFVVGILLLYGFGVLIVGNIAVSGINSPAYRYLAGTSLAYDPLAPTPTPPATPTPMPTIPVSQPGEWALIASELLQPIVITSPDDGTGRLFVATKPGVIWIIKEGETLSTPFIDLRRRVLQDQESPEQGFLGLTFHPNFAENGYFYVDYTDRLGDVNVVRFQVSATDPNQGDRDSGVRILRIIKPEAIHNGGNLAFGPDGYLYISIGDGGIRTDPGEYAQSLDALLGKILRLDVDGGDPYANPQDNPFVGRGGFDEIWLFGLRNPWRFSFDALTGDMYIGDVGHDDWEEINFVPAGSPGGLNFGWNHYEGTNLYTQSSNPPPSPLADHTPPIWQFRNHEEGTCAIVGGYVYRGEALPELQGTYLYGDYCSGIIWGLRQNTRGVWENTALFDTDFVISSFGVDAAQNLYLTDIRGMVYQLVQK